ncbi:MAG: TolC family outer membrane protein [Methylobacteriaceae bacterium]|nr:TolC family outer membrane protein [Methylobacteriaceae bacterium]
MGQADFRYLASARRPSGRRRRHACLRVVLFAVACLAALAPARAETLAAALAKAFGSHPELGQQRAALYVAQEGVAVQEGGYWPRLSASADIGLHRFQSGPLGSETIDSWRRTAPRSGGLTLDYTLFDAGRTSANVREAKAGARAANETLRAAEQTVLRNAAAAYMDVLRAQGVAALRRADVQTLTTQVAQTADRFAYGDVTRTDVAQVQAQLAGAKADALAAEADLLAASAVYRQVIGEAPRALAAAGPLAGLAPSTLEQAVALAQREHPGVRAAQERVDAARQAARAAEAELLPTLGVQARFGRSWDAPSAPRERQGTASLTAGLNVPIFQGGAPSARVRAAKHAVGQAQQAADVQRDVVRAQVVAAWAQWQASDGVLKAAQVQVRSAESAVAGLREEMIAGQRTTFDVLTAQTALTVAQISLLTAQRNRVVASFGLVAAMGRLTLEAARGALRAPGPEMRFAGPVRMPMPIPKRAPAIPPAAPLAAPPAESSVVPQTPRPASPRLAGSVETLAATFAPAPRLPGSVETLAPGFAPTPVRLAFAPRIDSPPPFLGYELRR